MNKHLYRIVFNDKRRQLMVVAETATGDGKSASGRRPDKRPTAPYWATRRALSFSLFAALGVAVCLPPTAQAQIVAYRHAPGNQQPTVLNAGNGVPLVNIQTPSAAGVSRNSYSQFDVQSAGAILNNSRRDTQTQLGGWVSGNPWLATGSARVILNQVISANPSLLGGYVEVAGSNAQVVIANPAGLTCAGCGFINAHRVTLSTGTPIVSGGNLDGYRVEGGTLRVEGAGLDASRVTQTDLIARAVEINSGLWANTLKITTGANQVDADHRQAAPIDGSGAAPAFALDVAQLGGMYAGKITLVGTEAGVGVRNAGAIGANVGEVAITADGRLHNSGRIASAGTTQIDTGGGIDNSGTVYALGDAIVATRDSIDNSGTLAAQGNATLETAGVFTNRATLQAGQRLDIKAAELDNKASGEIFATTLQLATPGLLTNRGLIDGSHTLIDSLALDNVGSGRIYGDQLAIAVTTLTNAAENANDLNSALVIAARERLDIGASTIVNREHALLFSVGDLAIGGALDASHHASGQASTLTNASATIEALGKLSINAGQISNSNAHFSTHVVALDSESIVEYQGSGAATRYLPGTPGVYIHNDESDQLMTPEGNYESWLSYNYTRNATETQVLTSDPGKIVAGGAMQLTADTLLNSDSQIIAGGKLSGAIGTLNNVETPGERTLVDRGSVTSYWRDHQKGRDSTGSSVALYAPPTTIESITLGSTLYQQNTAPGGQASQGVGGNGPAMLVRSVATDVALPDNSLFRTSPTAHYLVETDPQFANHRQWLSSDYQLNALAVDPTTAQKRLGDAFYEQRLVREQIAELTGRRFLDGYTSDEAQYRALMDAGITYARRWQLIPGVALAAEQMAQLTSDIVWLVEQDIVLADGRTTRALVPQVYVRVQDGDLAPSGALIGANDVDLRLSGDLTNGGTIAGRQLVALTAENIGNLGGRVSGQETLIGARHDLVNRGGTLQAQDRLIASASRDLTVESTTRTQTNDQGRRTHLDRVAGLYVTGSGGTLVAAAGNDLTLIAAAISNAAPRPSPDAVAGNTQLVAGRDLTLGTVTQAASQRLVWDGKNTRSDSQGGEIGSTLLSSGDLNLQAGRDVSARAAGVTSESGRLGVLAGNDIAISTGEARNTVDEAHQHSEKGFFSSTTRTSRDTLDATTTQSSTLSGDSVALQAGRDIRITGSTISAAGAWQAAAGRDIRVDSAQGTSTETHSTSVKKSGFSASLMSGISYGNSSQQQNAAGQGVSQVASTLAGADITTSSGRDTTISASNVLADRNLTLLAGRDVNVLAAGNTQATQSQFKSSSTTFGFGGGLGGRTTIYNNSAASEQGNSTSSSALTSLLSANSGDLTLRAGLDSQSQGTGSGNLTTEGADLLAGQSITLSGNAIDLQAAANESASHTQSTSRSFTVGAALAGTLGSQITAITDKIEQAQHTDNDRLQGALALKASYDAYKLATGQTPTSTLPAGTDTKEAANAGGPLIGVSVSLGHTSSRSESYTSDTAVTGTNLQARSIDITASETDLAMAAAKLQAETINLTAAKNIALHAAANQSMLESRNASGNTGVGVTFGIGQQNGFSIQLAAGRAQGRANGSETVWDNTQISATETLKLKSGADTTLKGAQLAGEHVFFDVGGDLLIETLQDSSNYRSRQSSSGFDISLCIPPICWGSMVSATGSLYSSDQKIKHNYLSAVGQSGISAGEGGFDIDVKGGADLIGAAITGSSDATKNRLSTASLTSRDLGNVQSTSSSSSSFSMAYTGSSPGATLAANATANLLANLQGNAALPKNGSERGTTQSVISPAQIAITGSGDAATDAQSQQTADQLTRRDAKTANASLKNTLTLQQAQELENQIRKAQENIEAAKLVGAVLSNVVGDLAKGKWADGSPQKLALHGMVGLIEAKIGGGSAAAGALGAMSQEVMAPILADYLRQNGFVAGSDEYKALLQLGATLVGSAVGTLASSDVKGTSTGADAAFLGMTNNFLTHSQADDMNKEVARCKAKPGGCQDQEAMNIIGKYRDKSTQNIAMVEACIFSGNVKCVQDLESQAASGTEVSSIFPFGYGVDAQQFADRQNNVTVYGSVRGQYSLFGTDAQQAQEIAKFRQDNCSGLASSACDAAVASAIDGRTMRVGVLMAVGSLTPAMINRARTLRMPGSVTPEELLAQAQAANASGAKFITKGVIFTDDLISSNAAVRSLFEDYKRVLGGDVTRAKDLTIRAVESGSDFPVGKQVGPNDSFVRMVAVGTEGPGVSSFYVSKAQFGWYQSTGMNAAQIADTLGLPVSSFAKAGYVGFQAYSVEPKPRQLTYVYQSQIAPVEQGSYKANGGAAQYIIPELGMFTEPVAISGGFFAPVPLSTIHQPSLGPFIVPVILPNGSAK